MKTMKWVLSVLALSAICARAGTAVDLSGDWKFRRDENKAGIAGKWFEAPLTGDLKMHLPGTMDEAKLGFENTKKPSLEGLYRPNIYEGMAWYQREIEIPDSWRGQRVTLFLERCRWVTQIWIDGKPAGDSLDSLIAPHVHELGTGIAPGRHTLTMLVDNTKKIELGVFVSALYGGTPGNLNGVVGKIELRETPPVWIDDVQVFPDAQEKTARVSVRIGNATGKAGAGKISINAQLSTLNAQRSTHEVSWTESGGACEFEIALRDAKLWDEFAPNLQRFDLSFLADTRNPTPETRPVVFGLRDLGTRGTQFTMNGRPIFLRGTLECQVFPRTGYPPCDVESWRKIYQIEKSYGLNFIRFHSWCPPDAAFEAADIEGVMIQAEAPQANVNAGSDPARDAFTEAELLRMIRTYGNHPSFCLMTLGNEYGGKDAVLSHWIDMLIKEDPRHLYSSASAAQTTANRQWTEGTFGRGVHGQGTMADVSGAIAHETVPPVGHEIAQWYFMPKLDEMKKYDGVFRPRNFEIYRDDLKAHGLLDQEDDFFRASGMQAILLYKEEIELLMRTPNYPGLSLLDLHDYPSQGTALIGLLDPFWDSKGLIAPEEHKRYFGSTVPLLRIPKRTFVVDEMITGIVQIAHFGPTDLKGAKPEWTIVDERGHEVAAGSLPKVDLVTGKLSPVGTISASLAKAAAPCKLKFTVSLKGTPFSNSWDIWAYPKEAASSQPAGVVVSHAWDDATKAALAEGKKVLLLPTKRAVANSLPGKFLPVFWSPVWFPNQKPNTMGILCDPKHPLFAEFPTEFYSNWQWWDVINNSRTLILDDTPADFRPLVQVIDNVARNHKLGNVFEARVGKGSLLVCAIDIEQKIDERPAARQFAKSLYGYLASPKFTPMHGLDVATLDKMFVSPAVSSTLVKLGAKIASVDSQQSGYEAEQAVDGDPNTIWHTSWEPSPKPMPHEIVIDIGSEITIRGVKYLPRQDMVNGRIAEFEIYVSGDGKSWGQMVAHGHWKNSDQEQVVRFKDEIKTRFVRLVAKSEVKGNAFAAVAEFDVIQ